MKKFLKVIGIIFLVLLILLIAVVGRIDRTPFEQTRHYAAWNNWIQQKDFVPSYTDSVLVGWAKTSITPDKPTPMAGYGDRWGVPFEGVRDSLFARAITVSSPGGSTLTLLAADMLIVPPGVTLRLQELLEKEGISMDGIHLGAIHTHHGMGAWGKKLIGRLFAGKFDESIEIMLAERMRDAILASRKELVPAKVGYSEIIYEEGIKNRVGLENPIVDSEVRGLRFDRADGKRAILLTYSAHSTILPGEMLLLSRDYGGHAVDALESSGDADFAVFMAGSVGSMGYRSEGEDKSERSRYLGEHLALKYHEGSHLADSIRALDSADTGPSNADPAPIALLSEWVHVPLPAPSARISLDYALRTWVYDGLFGRSPGDIKVSLIGQTLLLGMPADFSGEIAVELDEYARSKGLDLIITSFNGHYIGYITHDKLYEHNLYETVTMSWQGYQTGGYYTRMAKDIIDRLAATTHSISK